MATPSASNEALTKVKNQLECAICLQPYSDPKLLPCFHVFCKHCLECLVVQDDDEPTVICPKCRRPTPVPPNGATGLQSAFHIHNLFEIRDTLEKTTEPQKTQCENCKNATATTFCHDCGKFVCDKCTEIHQLWDEFTNHKVMSLSEVQSEAASFTPVKKTMMRCEKHSQKKLKIYCETCQELICTTCSVRLHQGHQYDLVTDTFPKHRDDILSNLQLVKQHLNTVNKALQALDTRKKEIADQRMDIEADIKKQLLQTLEQKGTELNAQLDQITQQNLKHLAAQKDEIELLRTQLYSCLEYVEGSLKFGSEAEILAMKASVMKQIQRITTEVNSDRLMPQQVVDMRLVPDHVIKQLQAITTEINPDILAPQQMVDTRLTPNDTEQKYETAAVGRELDPTKCYATGGEQPYELMFNQNCLKAATIGEETTVTLHAKNAEGREYQEPVKDLTAELASCTDGTIVKCGVTRQGKSAYRIRYQPVTRGKHQLHITIKGKQTKGSPHMVAVRPPTLDLGGQIRSISELNKVQGLATNSRGQIIVVERGDYCVSMLTPEGKKIRSFGNKGTANGQFRGPSSVAVDNDDNIYVADQSNHCIQKFTPDGEFIAAVGSHGTNPLQFSSPVGIGYNSKNDKLYVCDDSNNRIQILESSLAYSSTFGSRGSGSGQFRRPYDVGFDTAGNVYIVDKGNSRIQVFTPEGLFLRKFGNEESGSGQLSSPNDIAIDNDTVYITVNEYRKYRVSIFTTQGDFLHSFPIPNTPYGITVDENYFIMVTYYSDCIKVF